MTELKNENLKILENEFKKRSDVHLARKVWHMTGVFLMFVAWSLLPYWLSILLLAIGWVLFVPADLARQFNPKLNKVLTSLFKPIMRKNELDKMAGTTYLITGALFIALIFPQTVVSLSLLFLAFADPIASYVGIRWGKDKIFGHKSVQGFLAAFVVCFTVTLVYLYFRNISEYLLVVSLLAGVIGALAELVPVAKIDDNFTMPVLSSIGLSLVLTFFNIFEHLR